ncbi:hypothetical protein H1P_5830002 [Hyella patelloides LEGE 07179]|uniref:Uncharacterized protein n=1 Tax=Hyella patelloides LEGE 07179 TaxID=945734 RepID=A0A563W169_9CYAN|nr:hypothetical protein H1P_5830002 [Hyella patelloides LEGE 07179]
MSFISFAHEYSLAISSKTDFSTFLGVADLSNVTQNNTVRSYKLSCYKL